MKNLVDCKFESEARGRWRGRRGTGAGEKAAAAASTGLGDRQVRQVREGEPEREWIQHLREATDLAKSAI